jgi:hypothetical protein
MRLKIARVARPGTGIGKRLKLTVGLDQPSDGSAGGWLHLVESDLADHLVAFIPQA